MVDPLNVPRMRKAMPKPFKRPSIDLGGPKRGWEYRQAANVEPGDTIASMGLVLDVRAYGDGQIEIICGPVIEASTSHIWPGERELYVFCVQRPPK